eukprot:TRINITY_DN14095_c0_g1_i1.p1 TRINITY_DN14095_c0_g1~~TRINITY_DN14095_c0_g1_i1.p1  ORF type:complete len:1498 (-),score=371.28 TRINITY_DN14095_c0_g1_i1:213-4706(-)
MTTEDGDPVQMQSPSPSGEQPADEVTMSPESPSEIPLSPERPAFETPSKEVAKKAPLLTTEIAMTLDDRTLQLGLESVFDGNKATAKPAASDSATKTAERLLACMRTVAKRVRQTKQQQQLLELVHSWQVSQRRIAEQDDVRPETGDVLEEARLRKNFYEAMSSDCWRKRHLKSEQKVLEMQQASGCVSPGLVQEYKAPAASPTGGRRPSRLSSVTNTQGGGQSPAHDSSPFNLPPLLQAPTPGKRRSTAATRHSNLSAFALAKSSSSGTLRPREFPPSAGSNLLSLGGAVDVVKTLGYWDSLGTRAKRTSSGPLPRSISAGHISPSTMSLATSPRLAGFEATPSEFDAFDWQDTERSNQFTELPKLPESMRSIEDTMALERKLFEQYQPSLEGMRASPLVVFPRLAQRRPMPSRRMVFPTVFDDGDNYLDRYKAYTVRPARQRTSATPSVTHVSLTSSKEEALDEELGIGAPKPMPLPPELRHPPLWTRRHSMVEKAQEIQIWSKMGPSEHHPVEADMIKVEPSLQWDWLTCCDGQRDLPLAPRRIMQLLEAEAPNALPRASLDEPLSPTSPLSPTRGAGSPLGKRGSIMSKAGKTSKLLLKSCELGDRGLEALSRIMNRLQPMEVINLAGNKLVGPSARDFFAQHLPPLGSLLKELDVSRNENLGAAGINELARLMDEGRLRVLETFRLDAVPVPEACWAGLLQGVGGIGSVTQLGLADTGLGKGTQEACLELSKLVGDGVLASLDVSGNYFRHEGCAALGKALIYSDALRFLDISHNASHYLMAPSLAQASAIATGAGEAKAAAPAENEDGSAKKPAPACAGFSPMLSICEAVVKNQSLHVLAMANCALEYGADFILAQALARHKTLKWLDLSSNPHGGYNQGASASGLTCLLRVMAAADARVEHVNIEDMKESEPTPEACVYDFADPSGKYRLHLAHPQHRAVMRELLERPKVGGKASTAFFEEIEWDLPNPNIPGGGQNDLNIPNKKGWQVPTDGTINFTYKAAFEGVDANPLARAADWHVRGKQALNFHRSSILSNCLGFCSTDTMGLAFLRSLADATSLKLGHIPVFMQRCQPQLRQRALLQLLPAVTDLRYRLPFIKISNLKTEQHLAEHRIRQQVRDLLWLNLRNPNGHYRLDLSNSCDNAVAVRLQALVRFERLLQVEAERPDVSQKGTHEPVRNMLHFLAVSEIRRPSRGKKRPQQAQLHGHDPLDRGGLFGEWPIPNDGTLEFDYASFTKAPKADKASFAAKEKEVQQMLEVFEHSRSSPSSKLKALRSVADRLVLTAATTLQIVEAFRGFEADRVRHAEERLSELEVVVEAASICFPRCCERSNLVSDKGFYTSRCPPEEAGMLRTRLGRVAMFDWKNCESELSNLPAGNEYTFNLAIHEDRRIAQFLVELARRDGDENILKQRGYNSHPQGRGTFGLLPNNWFELWTETTAAGLHELAVPSIGLLKWTYSPPLPEGEETRPPLTREEIELRKEVATLVLDWRS